MYTHILQKLCFTQLELLYDFYRNVTFIKSTLSINITSLNVPSFKEIVLFTPSQETP